MIAVAHSILVTAYHLLACKATNQEPRPDFGVTLIEPSARGPGRRSGSNLIVSGSDRLLSGSPVRRRTF